MTTLSKSLLLGLVASAAFACSSDIDDQDLPDNDPGSDQTSGGSDTTFDHENDGKSPWQVIADQQIAGPSRFQARIHDCSVPLYQNLRNMLASRGINLAQAGANTAGGLYTNGGGALGNANYASRVRSNRVASTAGMVKLMDIFAAGSTEIITAFQNQTAAVDACRIGGTLPPLFDNGGTTCNRAAFSCLAGLPVTDAHLDICNKTIAGARNAAGANDQNLGQRLAVAVMLSAAHTCE